MDCPPREFFLDSKSISPPRRLQQQPQHPSNRQQQQSSGSGEFQPRRLRQAGEPSHGFLTNGNPPQR
jgi:hypothetical protein